MRMDLVEKHEAFLYEIEASVISLYHAHRELTDASVDQVYQSLQGLYKAKATQHPAPLVKLSPLEQGLFDDLQTICDAWMVDQKPKKLFLVQRRSDLRSPKTYQDIQEALKALRSSVRMWTKNFGRTGYLDYIDEFLD